MDALADLQKKRNETVNRIKELANQRLEAGEWKEAVDEKNYEEANDALAQIDEQMNNARQTDAIQQRLAELNDEGKKTPSRNGKRRGAFASTEETKRMALNGWIRSQMDADMSSEEEEACREIGLRPHAKRLPIDLLPVDQVQDMAYEFQNTPKSKREQAKRHFMNALEVGTASEGGNTVVPESLLRAIEVNMLAYGSVRAEAETIRTSTGEPLSWPTVDDTGNEARIVDEEATLDVELDPVFAKVTWGAYKFTSDVVKVSQELLEDTQIDLLGLIARILGERLGRGTNRKFTVGTGSGEPTGVVTASALGVSAASATAITADEVIDLQHSVDPAYRDNGAFMVNDTVIRNLRKLKDGEGNFLWQPSYASGQPDALAGSRVIMNQHMPAPTTGNRSMLYGDFSYYKIRTIRTARFYRLEELFRMNDQDGFVTLIREDGGLLSAGTPPVRHLIQA